MKFLAEINVMPLKALLDPQGKAVTGGLRNIGLGQIQDVRIGKHMVAEIEASDEKEAYTIAEDACNKLLHNPIMEFFEISIKAL